MSLFRTKNLDDLLAQSRAPGHGLKKVLGPLDLVLIGIGAIVGTGIFVLTGTGALTAGPALTISFVIAALACAFAALCYAEFASSIPSPAPFTPTAMRRWASWSPGSSAGT